MKRARFQASLDAQQLARFQSALGDGLLFGIVGLPNYVMYPLCAAGTTLLHCLTFGPRFLYTASATTILRDAKLPPCRW